MVKKALLFAYVVFCNFFTISHLSAQSSQEFSKGKDVLVVYSDVPGLTPSDKYSIRVRSAVTKNQWVNCFANYTYNRAFELPQIKMSSGTMNPKNVQNYQKFTSGWSQTYGTIEMTKNQAVEVEISSNVIRISKASAHPAEKASAVTVVGGKAYFTIDNPSQVVIDINGQMDDFNKATDDKSANQDYTTHTISIFANPLMNKSHDKGARILYIEPGVIPNNNPSSYDVVMFKPGIHDIGKSFKVYSGKKYYIPGDAIVYGTFNNIGLTASDGLQSGENITIYWSGTISGAKIQHPGYLQGTVQSEIEADYKSIAISNAMNVEINGVCVVDPAFHSVNLVAWGGRPDKTKEVTFARWVKVISWRANGDGIGSTHLVEDCFLRTADDCSYIKGSRRRCVFWKESNAAVFHMSGIPDPKSFFPIVIEDCDVIYSRTTANNYKAGIFVQRAAGEPAVQRNVNVLIRNIRITDPKSNMPVFNFFSMDSTKNTGASTYSYNYGSSYSGITFQNITVKYPPVIGGLMQVLTGNVKAPWYGGIVFDNVTIAGKQLAISDFKINEYVKDIVFTTAKK